jgi:hypothetical protein
MFYLCGGLEELLPQVPLYILPALGRWGWFIAVKMFH